MEVEETGPEILKDQDKHNKLSDRRDQKEVKSVEDSCQSDVEGFRENLNQRNQRTLLKIRHI